MKYEFEDKEKITGLVTILLKTAHLQLIRSHDLKVAYLYICLVFCFMGKKHRKVMRKKLQNTR